MNIRLKSIITLKNKRTLKGLLSFLRPKVHKIGPDKIAVVKLSQLKKFLKTHDMNPDITIDKVHYVLKPREDFNRVIPLLDKQGEAISTTRHLSQKEFIEFSEIRDLLPENLRPLLNKFFNA